MKIAVLAVQGAFIEHEHILERLGAECVELRKSSDLDAEFDGIVLPGGESTVQGKLLRELGMFDALHEKIKAGTPVLATCAGLILLAEKLINDDNTYFGTLPVTVRRNAYGRQLGSFSYMGRLCGIREEVRSFPLEFIRAPYIESVSEGYVLSELQAGQSIDVHTDEKVYVLAEIDRNPVAEARRNIVGVRYKNQIGVAFHPELTEDARCHELFLDMCRKSVNIIEK